MNIQISHGEILDKLSILELKKKFILDPSKLNNVLKELEYIQKHAKELLLDIKIFHLYEQLKLTNEKLWHIEENIRLKEQTQNFDEDFISLARSVYITNDKRAEIKKQINIITKSNFIEEKYYAKPNQ